MMTLLLFSVFCTFFQMMLIPTFGLQINFSFSLPDCGCVDDTWGTVLKLAATCCARAALE